MCKRIIEFSKAPPLKAARIIQQRSPQKKYSCKQYLFSLCNILKDSATQYWSSAIMLSFMVIGSKPNKPGPRLLRQQNYPFLMHFLSDSAAGIFDESLLFARSITQRMIAIASQTLCVYLRRCRVSARWHLWCENKKWEERTCRMTEERKMMMPPHHHHYQKKR